MAETIFMAIGLAMDASCVSMTNAMSERHMKYAKAILFTLLFGVFQTAMPIIGYSIASVFSKHILNFIPLIALILLSALGIKCIVEVIIDKKKGKAVEEKTIGAATILIQAIATSIDALSVGALFVGKSAGSAILSFGVIGVITWALSLISFFIGRKFGGWLKDKAAVVGGIILIIVGLKIFLPSVI